MKEAHQWPIPNLHVLCWCSDVIIDDKLMQQCKADFDIWFDSYAFGVLHRTEIE